MTRPQTDAVVVATAGMILPAIILILWRDASLILQHQQKYQPKYRAGRPIRARVVGNAG